ncbi:hypothetical protein [Salinicola sp. NYA28a]|jgi:hypothetical protein
MARWIGVDLDGTLAKQVVSNSTTIGAPIVPMLNRVKQWLDNGQEVRIFTARAGDTTQIEPIQRWLRHYGIGECAITDRKDIHMIELWDDKARRVERDTGVACRGCSSAKHSHGVNAMMYGPGAKHSDFEVDC